MADEVLQELRKIDSKNNFHITYLLTITFCRWVQVWL